MPRKKKLSKKHAAIYFVKMLFVALLVLFLLAGTAYGGEAAATAQAEAVDMLKQLVGAVCTIVMIIGALFCLVGIVKYAIAHAENQGPEQQKATMMLATGIVLMILPMILKNIQWDSLVSSALTAGQ